MDSWLAVGSSGMVVVAGLVVEVVGWRGEPSSSVDRRSARGRLGRFGRGAGHAGERYGDGDHDDAVHGGKVPVLRWN